MARRAPKPLEEQLSDIVQSFILCADAHKKARLEREEWRRNFEAEQRRAAQRRKEQQNHKNRAYLLQKAADQHQSTDNVRQFLAWIEASVQSGAIKPS